MSLLDEMDLDVVAFRPERAGESVEGEIVAIDSTTSDFTSDSIPVITLKDSDGTYRGLRGYHSVLRNELDKIGVAIGDTLAVKYEGKKKNKSGTGTYHSYKVRAVKAGDKPNF